MNEELGKQVLSEEGSRELAAEWEKSKLAMFMGQESPTKRLKELLWIITRLTVEGLYQHLDYDCLEEKRAHVYKALLSNWKMRTDWPQFYTYKKIALTALHEYKASKDLKLHKMASEWISQNQIFFDFSKFYGIELEVRLAKLLQEAVQEMTSNPGLGYHSKMDEKLKPIFERLVRVKNK